MTPSAPSVIDICTGGNSRIAAPFMAMVASLVTNARSHPVNFYILDAGLRQVVGKALDRLTSPLSNFRILWVSLQSEKLNGLPARKGLPREAFMRLLMPEVLPNVARVIWLDCDTLVLRDLAELWSADLDGLPLGAVREFGVTTVNFMVNEEVLSAEGRQLKGYVGFNSGVMLIDLDLWRRHSVGERTLQISRTYGDRIVYADQDSLNAVLAGYWKQLDLMWNVQMGALRSMPRVPRTRISDEVFYRRCDLVVNPGIVHFAGDKPWEAGLRSPFRRIYFYFLRESGLFGKVSYWSHYLKCTLRAIFIFVRSKFISAKSRLNA